MRAERSDRQQLVVTPCKNHRFAVRMSQKHGSLSFSTIGDNETTSAKSGPASVFVIMEASCWTAAPQSDA